MEVPVPKPTRSEALWSVLLRRRTLAWASALLGSCLCLSLILRLVTNPESPVGEILLNKGALEGQAFLLPILNGPPTAFSREDGFVYTPVMLASGAGHTESLRVLLRKGARVDGRTRRSKTAVMLAACRGYSDIGKLLLSAGADAAALDDEGNSALHFAAYGGTNRSVSIMMWHRLGPMGVWKQRPARGEYAEMIRDLLRSGADPTQANGDGKTPLEIARDSGRRDLAELLSSAVRRNARR